MLCFDGFQRSRVTSIGCVLRLAVAGHTREMPMPRRQTSKALPGIDYELSRVRAGFACVVGIDEAGIGPWAGPVVAAAVRIDPKAIPDGLADSKALTAHKREVCYGAILRLAQVGVGIADVARIDRDNVLRASHWAMGQAVRALAVQPDLAIIDGVHAPDLGCIVEAVIGGDAKVASIAAASIVAKVTRDRLMARWAEQYPDFGFERHMGYGTAQHRAAIAEFGITPIHRRSFRPVQLALARLAREAET